MVAGLQQLWLSSVLKKCESKFVYNLGNIVVMHTQHDKTMTGKMLSSSKLNVRHGDLSPPSLRLTCRPYSYYSRSILYLLLGNKYMLFT